MSNLGIALTEISCLTLSGGDPWRFVRFTLSYDNMTLYQCSTSNTIDSFIYSTPINYSGGFQIL
jgi:hypothetical protein